MTGEFFIGWRGRTGPALGRFLSAVVLISAVGFGLIGYGLGAEDGGPEVAGRVGFEPELPGVFTGTLMRGPVPLLRVEPSAALPQGATLMMVLWDKRGVPVAEDLYGQRVSVEGVIFRRGDLGMLVFGGGFTPTGDAGAPSPVVEPLGRWRITGEICDGKCYSGIMKPGEGLGHRACAQLCFVGEVPAVFVTAAPVEGTRFFILANTDGGPPPPEARHLFGVPIDLEGALERRGDVTVFRADFTRARLR